MTTGDIEITVNDGSAGTVVVPATSVQLVIGTCSSGTAAQIVATRSPNTLQTSLGYGLLPEAAALACLAGGTVLAMKAATNTAGIVIGSNVATLAVTGATNASPCVLTVASTTTLSVGDVITVASVGGTTGANGTFIISALTSTTITLYGSTGGGVYTSGGTVQFTGVAQRATATTPATGTSVATITLDGTNGSFDDYNVKVLWTKSGTIGATGILFKVSLDAGRTYGPTIALGTATSYVIPNTGITVALAAGTVALNESVSLSTSGPVWAEAGILACFNAFQASPYAAVGIGSIHIVGVSTASNAATFQTYMNTLATGFIYNRAMISARDALRPHAWGGVGETESTWMTSVNADFASTSAKRMLSGAGYYNMPSAFPNAAAGAPRYRRSLTWAQACRQIAVPAQRHSGRVRDGALANIVIDSVNDPNDGFIYHDERINPGFDILQGGAGRMCSARTRVGLPGFYIVNPLLLSPLGSDFTIWPLGAVMDVACAIIHQVGQNDINADVRLNPNGTLYENEALRIERNLLTALNTQMTATAMISSATVTVDRSNNVQTTSKVKISVTIYARGYILEEDIEIALGSAQAAA